MNSYMDLSKYVWIFELLQKKNRIEVDTHIKYHLTSIRQWTPELQDSWHVSKQSSDIQKKWCRRIYCASSSVLRHSIIAIAIISSHIRIIISSNIVISSEKSINNNSRKRIICKQNHHHLQWQTIMRHNILTTFKI